MQGETRKIPPAAFVSFGAQKKTISRFCFLLRSKGRRLCVIRDTLSKSSSCSGALAQTVRRAQARYEYAVRLAGYLDFPLLPFGISSPMSD